MSPQEIQHLDSIALEVNKQALARSPWLANLREPTAEEVAKTQRFCERFPTREQAIDNEPTKVLDA